MPRGYIEEKEEKEKDTGSNKRVRRHKHLRRTQMAESKLLVSWGRYLEAKEGKRGQVHYF
jgi:hypothetical protein